MTPAGASTSLTSRIDGMTTHTYIKYKGAPVTGTCIRDTAVVVQGTRWLDEKVHIQNPSTS